MSAPDIIKKYIVVPIALLLFWLIISLIVVSSESFTVLTYPETNNSRIVSTDDGYLMKGQKLRGEFVARQDNLGIVSVKVDKVSYTGEEDLLVFRIKEQGASDWLHTNEYKGGIFRGSRVFTFGFPIIESSRGHTYYFELESLKGTAVNAIQISNASPIITSRYKFSKSDILNTSFFPEFLIAKVHTLFINTDHLSSTVIFLMPFVLYIMGLLYNARNISVFKKYQFIALMVVLFIFYDTFFARLHLEIVFFTLLAFWLYAIHINKMSHAISLYLALLILVVSVCFTYSKIEFSINRASAWIYFLILIAGVQSIYGLYTPAADFMRNITSRLFAPLHKLAAPKIEGTTLLVIVVMLFIYRNWLGGGLLTAPDFPYYFTQRFSEINWLPSAWTNLGASSLGEPGLSGLNLNTYVSIGTKLFVQIFRIPWDVASRMLFFWPFLLVGALSSYYCGYFMLKNRLWATLSMLIYLSNSYILMIAGGGQVGIFMAYAIAPLVLGSFTRRSVVIFTIALTLILLFDLRISLLIFFVLFLYVICVLPVKEWSGVIRFGILPAVITLGLHSFWLLPVIAARGITLPGDFADPKWLTFLSWAEFSKTLSLLHPNWPENIFGKTYFMQPEFLLLPIAAYGSLYLLIQKRRGIIRDVSVNAFPTYRILIFVSLLGLIGAFLSKGVNPPIGELYRWMFEHVPFFSAFREPTKFYLLTSLSYSVLIPWSLMAATTWIEHRFKYVSAAPVIVFILSVITWSGIIRQVFLGEVRGSFSRVTVPPAYQQFAGLVTMTPDFSRTLAAPWKNRFIYESENHPVISASEVFHTTDIRTLADILETASAAATLRRLAVTHIVVPDDFMHEIFLTDRQYDPNLQRQLVRSLDNQQYFRKRDDVVGLDVYAATSDSGLFYADDDKASTLFPHSMYSPAKYIVTIPDYNTISPMVFAQGYDPGWRLWDGNTVMPSEKTADGLNSFRIEVSKPVTAEVYYEPQQWVDKGYKVTVFIFIIVMTGIVIRQFSKILPLKFSYLAFILTLGMASYIWRGGFITPREVITDPNIRWGQQWGTVSVAGFTEKVSRYGGSEMLFVVPGGSGVKITIAQYRPEQDNAVQIWVDGKEHAVSETANVSEQTIHILAEKHPRSVRVRTYCSGDLFCQTRIRSIKLHNKGSLAKVNEDPVTKMAVLGDSLTSLYGHHNYVYKIADKLNWQIHNASFIGSTLTDHPGVLPGITRLKSDIVAIKPDVIVLALGTNDAIQRVPIDEFVRTYEQMIADIRESLPNVKMYSVGLLANYAGVIPVVDGYNNAIKAVSKAQNVSYIPMNMILQKYDFVDTIHPSEEAQEKMAEHVLTFIE